MLTPWSELGQIKYLKDADDNDLDPEQFVSDVFVDEGKALKDGHDQEAVIKVVQDQRYAVRQGSVVPDLTPVHYQPRALPPVPRFNDVTSSLGKRGRTKALNGTNHAHPDKRARLEEIQETQDEDQVIPSVEQSPELIHDTQELDVSEEDHQESSAEDVDHRLSYARPHRAKEWIRTSGTAGAEWARSGQVTSPNPTTE